MRTTEPVISRDLCVRRLSPYGTSARGITNLTSRVPRSTGFEVRAVDVPRSPRAAALGQRRRPSWSCVTATGTMRVRTAKWPSWSRDAAREQIASGRTQRTAPKDPRCAHVSARQVEVAADAARWRRAESLSSRASDRSRGIVARSSCRAHRGRPVDGGERWSRWRSEPTLWVSDRQRWPRHCLAPGRSQKGRACHWPEHRNS